MGCLFRIPPHPPLYCVRPSCLPCYLLSQLERAMDIFCSRHLQLTSVTVLVVIVRQPPPDRGASPEEAPFVAHHSRLFRHHLSLRSKWEPPCRGASKPQENPALHLSNLLCNESCTTFLRSQGPYLCFCPISRSKGPDGGVRNARLTSQVTCGLHMNIWYSSSQEKFFFVNRAARVWYQIIALPYSTRQDT